MQIELNGRGQFVEINSWGVQDKPYALFGTCLGAITAYEIARVVEREKLAPMPVALYAAAVSPPHLYAYAVMKLYMTRQLAADEPPPFEEVMEKLRGWDKLPKETLMLVRILLINLSASRGHAVHAACKPSGDFFPSKNLMALGVAAEVTNLVLGLPSPAGV